MLHTGPPADPVRFWHGTVMTQARGRDGDFRKELAAGVNLSDVRFEADADIGSPIVPIVSAAFDPERSLQLRRGTDVLKALALGAVRVCRPAAPLRGGGCWRVGRSARADPAEG